jgi:16S rRNA (uracil1498-N3)-methyltransferase
MISPERLKGAMRRFFIQSADAAAGSITVEGSEARHMIQVLRLKPGDSVRLYDGAGGEYEGLIRSITAGRAEVVIEGKVPQTAESPLHLVVAQGFLKERKMEELIRPLSELGAVSWIPFFCERSIPRPDPQRLAARVQRWHKIARESLKQCRRSKQLDIQPPTDFETVLKSDEGWNLKLIFWENESATPGRDWNPDGRQPLEKILIMLGPEGGFSEQEVRRAQGMGFAVAGLGPRILRAQTATLAACALMQFLFGDLGPKKP